jgi:hypothetical protein
MKATRLKSATAKCKRNEIAPYIFRLDTGYDAFAREILWGYSLLYGVLPGEEAGDVWDDGDSAMYGEDRQGGFYFGEGEKVRKLSGVKSIVLSTAGDITFGSRADEYIPVYNSHYDDFSVIHRSEFDKSVNVRVHGNRGFYEQLYRQYPTESVLEALELQKARLRERKARRRDDAR